MKISLQDGILETVEKYPATVEVFRAFGMGCLVRRRPVRDHRAGGQSPRHGPGAVDQRPERRSKRVKQDRDRPRSPKAGSHREGGLFIA